MIGLCFGLDVRESSPVEPSSFSVRLLEKDTLSSLLGPGYRPGTHLDIAQHSVTRR